MSRDGIPGVMSTATREDRFERGYMAKCYYLGGLRKVQREKVRTCCSYFLEGKVEKGGRRGFETWGDASWLYPTQKSNPGRHYSPLHPKPHRICTHFLRGT